MLGRRVQKLVVYKNRTPLLLIGLWQFVYLRATLRWWFETAADSCLDKYYSCMRASSDLQVVDIVVLLSVSVCFELWWVSVIGNQRTADSSCSNGHKPLWFACFGFLTVLIDLWVSAFVFVVHFEVFFCVNGLLKMARSKKKMFWNSEVWEFWV